MSCGHAGSISAVDLKQVAGGKSPGRRGQTRSDLLLLDVTVRRRVVNLNGEPREKISAYLPHAQWDLRSLEFSSRTGGGSTWRLLQEGRGTSCAWRS